MNTMQLCGVIGVIVVVIVTSILSGRKVKNSDDFESSSGKAGYGIVSGIIMGTIIGGASTIGTAQLAYSYGLSAWWYTISCGAGCLLMGILAVKPYRRSKESTLIGILRHAFGVKAGVAASSVYALATLLGLIAQLLSASAVLPFIFPGINGKIAILGSALLMLLYVAFGGALGIGQIGKIKTVLLYISIASGAFIVLKTTGLQSMWNTLDHNTYFNLFFFGHSKELSKALSVMLGLFTSQTYMQALRSSRSDQVARRSEFISALLIPPIGFGSMLIGMFMQIHHPALANAKDALPQFVLNYMPDWLSGIVMGTLLLATIGSGASIVLGSSVSVCRDIVQPVCKRFDAAKHSLLFMRLFIMAFLLTGCLLASGLIGDFILNITSIGAGLRATGIIAPLVCALLFPEKIKRTWALVAVLVGPALVAIFSIWNVLPFDPLFVGILGSLICCAIGWCVSIKR